MIGELSFDLPVLWIIMDMDESWCEEPQVFIYLANLDYPLLCKSCQSKASVHTNQNIFSSPSSKQQHECYFHRGQLVLNTEEWFCNSRESRADNIGKLETFQKLQICPFILLPHPLSVFLPGHLLPALPADQVFLLFSPYGTRRLSHYVNPFPFRRLTVFSILNSKFQGNLLCIRFI